MMNDRFVESIQIRNNQLLHLPLHEARFNKTRFHFFGITTPFLISSLFSATFWKSLDKYKVYKLRVVYAEKVENWELIPYERPKIESLRLVTDNCIGYHWKSLNRDSIQRLYLQKANADDILIVKNSLITDSSYMNVAFLDKNDKWLTPQTPLLGGTQRAYLLSKGIIEEATIGVDDVFKFSHIRLFNALNSWEEAIELPISAIIS
ncbi:MAG: hypothetical protein EAZ55_11550 [Cytophagales bacterium]|nr:MAG: hypothetical protein EAZ55_11550 [Cytophagales bacterium]